MLAEDYDQSHWRPVDAEAFGKVWSSELADLPEYEMSTLHLVAGLLLPLWKRLTKESARIYRLQTSAGARSIGRPVTPTWAERVRGQARGVLAVPDAWGRGEGESGKGGGRGRG